MKCFFVCFSDDSVDNLRLTGTVFGQHHWQGVVWEVRVYTPCGLRVDVILKKRKKLEK
jgi:hypothetical protein